MFEFRLIAEPGCRIGLGVKEICNLHASEACGECLNRHRIEPIVKRRVHFERVTPYAGVAHLGVAGQSSIENDARPRVDCLRGRLLIAAVSEGSLAGCPGMAGVDIEVSKEWEQGIVPVGIREVLSKQIDHASPLVL